MKKVRYGKMTHGVCAASKQLTICELYYFIVKRTKGSKMSEPLVIIPDDCGE